MTGGWTTVEKKKSSKKKLEEAAALMASSTSFSAFEDEASKTVAADMLLSDSDSDNEQTVEAKKKKRGSGLTKTSLAKAGSTITADLIKAQISEVDLKYPHRPDLLLRCVAEIFAQQFKNASINWDKIFEEKSSSRSKEIPLCYVSSDAQKEAMNIIALAPSNEVQSFSHSLLPLAFPSSTPKVPLASDLSIGLRAFLQLTLRRGDAFTASDVNITALAQHFSDKKTPVKATHIPLFIWFLLQFTNPVPAVQLWCVFLLPIIDTSSVSGPLKSAAITALRYHLSSSQSEASVRKHRSGPVFSAKTLQQIVKLASTGNTSVRSEFTALCADVANWVRWGTSQLDAKALFPELLPLCGDTTVSHLVAPILSSLVVVGTSRVHAVWEENYRRNLSASWALLAYARDTKTRLWENEGEEAIGVFLRKLIGINEQLASNAPKSKKTLSDQKIEAEALAESSKLILAVISRQSANASSSGGGGCCKLLGVLVVVVAAVVGVASQRPDLVATYLK